MSKIWPQIWTKVLGRGKLACSGCSPSTRNPRPNGGMTSDGRQKKNSLTKVSDFFSEPDLLNYFQRESVNLDILMSLAQDLFRTDLAKSTKEKKPMQNISKAKTFDGEFNLGNYALYLFLRQNHKLASIRNYRHI